MEDLVMMRGLILITVLMTACASRNQAGPVDFESEEPAQLPMFQQGVKALEQEQYNEAARIFDRLLVSKPATEHDLVTTFNSAAAYEGLGNCSKAAERYREVTRASSGKFPRIEGLAFYRLSLMYECLGQDVKSVTALLDARKRGQELPFATLHAEIPARLAAAYARLGNRKKALEYFALAGKGLKRIATQESGKRRQDILGQSLFLMGQLNPAQRRAEGDPVAFLKGLSMQQPHLLQAVELQHPVWSKKAAGDLEMAYDNFWKFKFGDNQKQNDFYIRAMQVVRELKRIRLPKADPEVDAIYAKVDAAERRLNVEIARVAESTKLTPEAEKREGLRREGRLVDPEPLPKKKAPTKQR